VSPAGHCFNTMQRTFSGGRSLTFEEEEEEEELDSRSKGIRLIDILGLRKSWQGEEDEEEGGA